MNEKLNYSSITLNEKDEEQLKDAANVAASSGRVASEKALEDNTVYTVKSAHVESFVDSEDKSTKRYFVDIIFEGGAKCPSGCFNGTPLGDALTYASSVCKPSDTVGQRVYKNARAIAGSSWMTLGHSTELVGKRSFKHTTWRNKRAENDDVVVEETK